MKTVQLEEQLLNNGQAEEQARRHFGTIDNGNTHAVALLLLNAVGNNGVKLKTPLSANAYLNHRNTSPRHTA